MDIREPRRAPETPGSGQELQPLEQVGLLEFLGPEDVIPPRLRSLERGEGRIECLELSCSEAEGTTVEIAIAERGKAIEDAAVLGIQLAIRAPVVGVETYLDAAWRE
jgi:hypothetical protein